MKTKLLLITIVLFGFNYLNAQSIAGGQSHSVFLCNNKASMTTGYALAALGTGTTSNSSPILVNSLSDITAVAAGFDYSIFLKNDGTVWACGRNESGKLGDGTTITRSIPIQVIGLTGIKAVSAFYYYSLFLKNDGTVWACGNSQAGGFGDGTSNYLVPIQISSLTGVIAISSGDSGALYLKSDGSVWASGSGSWNGVANTFTNVPVQVISLSNIIGIAAGGLTYFFLKNDGTVWASGGSFASLGLGGNGANTPVQVSPLNGITSIKAGLYHTLFLKNDGTVWACGLNQYGELGDGTIKDRNIPVKVNFLTGINSIGLGIQHSLFLKNDGVVWACGYGTGFGSSTGGTGTVLNPIQVSGLCSGLLGIEEPKILNNIRIYPNPANDNITIDCGNISNVDGYQIKITNTLGQEVFHNAMNRQLFNISLSSLTGRGIYFVNIIDAQGQIIDVKKIVLQ